MADAKTLGLDRIKARIAAMPGAVRTALQAELEAEGDELVTAMQRLVHKRSGELEASIRKEPGERDLQVIVRAGGATTTKPVRKGASATYDYALAEEFGNKHSSAQPFFFPTYRAKRKAFRRRRTAVAKKAIAEVAGT